MSALYNASVTPTLTAAEWDAFVQSRTEFPPALDRPSGHVLQSSAWAELKSGAGWSAVRVVAREKNEIVAGAQILFRPLPLALGAIAYIPKGPLLDWTNKELSEYLLALCDQVARANRAVLLKIEPELPHTAQTADVVGGYGLRRSPHAVQPQRTILVDLTGGEDEILARMKPKTRYNIRLAAKKGVTVRTTCEATAEADLTAFNRLVQTTAMRDRFGVHTPAYYRSAYQRFGGSDQAALVLAEHEGRPLAGVMAFTMCGRAWYFYGASSDAERQRMPSYAAQWAAMRWAKTRGCHTYDLWGVPDADESELEAHFTTRTDGLWPVYRFKRGFGGRLARSVGAWDRVYSPWAYRLYLWYVNRRRDSTAT